MIVSFDLASVIPGIGIFVAVVVGLAILFLSIRGIIRFFRRLFAPKLEGMDLRAIQARWKEIEKLSEGGALNLKIAVMEADTLLDHALKSRAVQGNTLGERLKSATYRYPKIKNVWNAHRLRNQLAHEASFYLDPATAKKAIRDFKDALRVLSVL